MRILLADDEPMIRDLYRDMLQGNGHSVDTVSDGTEVLERISEADYGLLILDLFMPGMDGFKTLTELKKVGQKVPVIVMTGHYPDDEVRGRIAGLGVREVLRKPVMITALERAVESAGCSA